MRFFLVPVLVYKINGKICRQFQKLFTQRRLKLRFQKKYESEDIPLSFEFFLEQIKRFLTARIGKFDQTLNGIGKPVEIILVKRRLELLKNHGKGARIALSCGADNC